MAEAGDEGNGDAVKAKDEDFLKFSESKSFLLFDIRTPKNVVVFNFSALNRIQRRLQHWPKLTMKAMEMQLKPKTKIFLDFVGCHKVESSENGVEVKGEEF